MKRELTIIAACALLMALVLGGFAADAADKNLEERVSELEQQLAALQPGGNDFETYWKDGVRIESADGDIKIKMGGRLMFDAILLADESDEIKAAIGEQTAGAEVRRARFFTSGTLYDAVDFKLQFDWAGSATALKDAYIALRETPLGRLQVGHFYEPYSLNALVSSKHNTFMEWAPPVSAFAPVRNDGGQLSSTALDQRATWAAGAFWEADSHGKVNNENRYAFTGRLTGLPLYEKEGAHLVHVGLAGGYRNLDGTGRFSSRPPLHATDVFVDTRSTTTNPDTGEDIAEDLPADDAWLYGLELATVCKAFHAQAELTGSTVDTLDGSYDAVGWYAQAGYFFTGEVRPYSKANGRFVAVEPASNFGQGGRGAWELAARYSTLDLSDGAIMGGELDDITVGVNWYLNPAVRVMINYVYADPRDMGDAHFIGSRFQVVF